MKRVFFLATLLAIRGGRLGCGGALFVWLVFQSGQIVVAAPLNLAEPWHVTERAAHSRVWESVELATDPATGKVVPRKHSYVELATGLHFLDPATGQWQDSEAKFEITPTGDAVALKGQHQLRLGANINSGASVDLLAGGKRFLSNPMGLSFFDSATEKNVLLAEVKDCVGELVAPNVILYRDAFTDIKGAIRYTYTKAGFEQDIILYQNPGSPAEWGLNPATTRLVMYSEFFDPPVPQKTVRLTADNLEDETLDFGQLQIAQGVAYFQHQELEAVKVAKQWIKLEGRDFLVEAVPYSLVQPLLEKLQASVKRESKGELAKKAISTRPELLAKLEPKRGNKRSEVAAIKAGHPTTQPAFVLDYVSHIGTLSNYQFEAHNTYLITGAAYLYGTNNVIEGGTVIKFSANAGATINVKGVLRSDTGIYRPGVLTAIDDNTVGESLGGTLSGGYASIALDFDYATSSQAASLQNLHILHAVTGVRFNTGSGHELRHIQLLNCGTAIQADSANYAVRNVLGWNLTNALAGSGSSTGVWEHATLDGVTNLVSSVTGFFTNCLLTAVVSTNGLSGASNVVVGSSNGIYKTVVKGYHYLADSSPYRDLGTTNIDSTLASELKTLTTYGPVALGNLTTNTTLTPQAGRDTGVPDVGFHYSPLDYIASGVDVASNVTVWATNGVAVGIDHTASFWGFILNNAKFVSTGDPLHFNYVVRAHTVQETASSWGAPFYDGNSSSGSRDCELRLRFTEFTQLAYGGYMLYSGTQFGAIEFTHSRIYNTSLVVENTGSGTLVCGLTNSYWERGGVQFGLGTASASGVTVHLRNNLARNVCWLFASGNTNWTVRDNLFDTMCSLSDYGTPIENSYNAYYNTTYGLTNGTSNLALTNLVYEVGPLGKYYQPTNSPLLDAGSRYATNAGLYHFTTRTNQVKEANSIVDIGYHHVALDANGQPIDTDGDGVPDYIEDTNGNGIYDPSLGETDWQSSGSGTGVPRLELFTPLKW